MRITTKGIRLRITQKEKVLVGIRLRDNIEEKVLAR